MKGCGKMFETGEYVVYGRTGICKVTGVTTMKMDGASGERLYYVLRPGGETEGKIFTPVEGGKQVLRGIITKEEAEKLINEIPLIETLSIENEKFREDSYKKCIRTCECRDLLRIIKTIYIRKQTRLSHGKKTTATDERYLKMAEDHLYSEFSMLLDIPKDHMADYIKQHIRQQREETEQACAV
ncbi:MAG TPA: CarD family transcriptional regulator [Lachnoclostridium sp.]|nr:CarD family transcriptional regulator [Ruminococcus sp. AF46-10NS]HBM46881.1 CarD family transcriptional regulator [Lachnoclostridium sp.]